MIGMNRNQTAETLFGDSLMMCAPALNVPNPRCCFSGYDASNRHVQVPFNEDMLGRHLMLLGGHRHRQDQRIQPDHPPAAGHPAAGRGDDCL